MQGAINLHCEIPGALHHISFSHLLIDQLNCVHPEQGWYDIRPPCNQANPGGMGLDNAYAINPATQRPRAEPRPAACRALRLRRHGIKPERSADPPS